MIVIKPLVSVIMSVNKDGQNFSETISSILGQTYRDIEFIVVNDGGGSVLNQKMLSFSDTRMIILDQPWKGLTKSLNDAIKYSRGEYIARMDAGDISLPDRISRQVQLFEKNPNMGLVGTSYMEIDEDGNKIAETVFSTDGCELKNKLRFQNQFCHGSVMFRRQCLEKVGPYREEFVRAQDYDLWLRISEYYDIANLPEILYIRKTEKESISISLKGEQNKYATIAREYAQARRKGTKEPVILFKGLNKSKSQIQLSDNHAERLTRFYLNFHHGRLLFKQRKFKASRMYFLESLKNNPFRMVSWGFTLFSFLPARWVDRIEPVWKNIQRRSKIIM